MLLDGFIFYDKPNLDSLEKVIDSTKSSSNIVTYNDNGISMLKIGKRTKKQYYNLDQNNCFITLQRRKKSKKVLIVDILLMNEKHLITRHPNPKTYTIGLYRRA